MTRAKSMGYRTKISSNQQSSRHRRHFYWSKEDVIVKRATKTVTVIGMMVVATIAFTVVNMNIEENGDHLPPSVDSSGSGTFALIGSSRTPFMFTSLLWTGAAATAETNNNNIPNFKYPRQRPVGYERQKRKYQNIYDGNAAAAAPSDSHQKRGGGVVFNPDPLHPPPLVLRHYSLAQVCKEDINKHCGGGGGGGERKDGLGLRSPYGKVVIACLNAHRNELSEECKDWHEARNTCSSELRAASTAANKVGGIGEEEDGGQDAKQQQQDDDGGGGVAAEDMERNRPIRMALRTAPPSNCREVCKEHCREGGSLLMCMRTLGREIKAITSKACFQSDFAKSVVRALRK